MSDLLFQNLSTVQNKLQPMPVTIDAATTIAPSTFITFIADTADIAQITPPVTGSHMLCFIFTDAAPGSLLTTGNILVGTTTIVQNVPVLVFYDPISAVYYCGNLGA